MEFHDDGVRVRENVRVNGHDHDPTRGRDYGNAHANVRDHARICDRVNDRARVCRCVSCLGEFGYKYPEFTRYCEMPVYSIFD